MMSNEHVAHQAETLYVRIGGAPVIESVVHRFYDLMDLEPKYQALRDAHGSTLEEAGKRLFMFLSGWMGGPNLYVEQHGHPRLKSRHFPFKIGTVERDQWVACFMQALSELAISAAIQIELLLPIYALAEWMRNQEDVVEGAPLPPMQGQMSREYVIDRLAQLAQKYAVEVAFIKP